MKCNGYKNCKGYVALTSVLILSALFVIISVAAFGSSVTQINNISASISSKSASNITSDCAKLVLSDIKSGDKEVFFGTDNFNVLNEDYWQTYGESFGSISVNDSELTITNDGGSTEDFIGIATKINFPVGTVVKAKVKNPEGRHSSMVAIGEEPFNPYPHSDVGGINKGSSLYSRADDPSASISIRDEDGYNSYKSPSIEDYKNYNIVELRRTSKDLIEYFVNDEKVGQWGGIELKNDYYVYFSADGYTKPNTIVIDWVEVINPFEKKISEDKKCKGKVVDLGELGYAVLSEGNEGLFSKKTKTDIAALNPDPLITNTQNYSGKYLIKGEHDYTDWKLGSSDLQVNTQEEDLKLPEFGNALEFDGDDDYIDIGDNSESSPYNFTTQNFSVSFWAKQDTNYTQSNQRIVSRGSYKNTGWEIFLDDHHLEVRTYAGDYHSSSYTLDPGSWKHYTIVKYSSDSIKIYVNGEEKVDSSGHINPHSHSGSLRIGNYSGSTYNYKGKIDDVRIYNKALTPRNIQEIMYNPATGNESGLVGYWNLDEGEGTTVEDLSRYNRDGSFAGNPIWIKSFSKGERTSTPLDLSSISSTQRSNINWIDKSGLSFDGIDDYVEVPPSSIPTGSEITVSVWAKGGSKLPKTTAVIEGRDANDVRTLNIHFPWSNGDVYFDCGNNGTDYNRIVKHAHPDEYKNKWNHWAFTKNANTGEMKIYLNGKLWHKRTGKTFTIPETTGSVIIGAGYTSTDNYYHGSLDDIKIYGRELSKQEIQKIYHGKLIFKDDLTGYWNFNEGEGDIVNDSSGNENDGTLNGDPKWLSTKIKSAVTGHDKLQSISFDGSDDYIETNYNGDPSEVSLSAWIKINSSMLSNYGSIISTYQGSAASKSYEMLSNDVGGVRFHTSGDRFDSNQILRIGKWYHVVSTWDGSTGKIYINGNLDNSDSTLTKGSNDIYWEIGRSPRNVNHFDGNIDDVRVYNRALSQTEVEKLYNQEAVDDGLVGYWPLSEGTGGTAYDQSINSNDGTINGATWSTDSSGAVPGGYHVMEKGESIPDISRGDDLDSKYLWLRQTLSTEDPFHSPKLEALKVEILGD